MKHHCGTKIMNVNVGIKVNDTVNERDIQTYLRAEID
jgi:hypothetical protein